MSNINDRDQSTSSALLEQLVYIDNFMSSTNDGTPNLDVDGQLSLDLAAFADDSFIFPDAEKPNKKEKDEEDQQQDNEEKFQFIEGNSNGFKDVQDRKHLHDDNNLSGILNKLSPAFDNHNFEEKYGIQNHAIVHSGNEHPKEYETSGTVQNTNSINTNATINVSELPKVAVPPGAQSSLVAAGLSQNQIDLLAALVAQHQQGKGTSNESNSSTDHFTQSPVRQNNTIPTILDPVYANTPNSTSSSSSLAYSTRPREDSPNLSNFNQSYRSNSFDSSNGGEFKNIGSTDLDKRRKNTAASARFRIKKKQKEKEMQQTIQNLSEASTRLENKIQQLEMENKLLRNLIVEKGSKRSDDELRQLKNRAQSGFEDMNGF